MQSARLERSAFEPVGIKGVAKVIFLALLASVSTVVVARAQSAAVKQRVAAIKQSLADSQASLRHYEWIETTVISHDGEEKFRKQERCYYDAEGKVQKVLEGTESEGKTPPGLRGRIAERKKEEVTDYMKSAVAKIQEYVPLDSSQVQKVADAGNLSITPLPSNRVQVDLHDYLEAGDLVTLEFDLQSNNILSAKIATYVDSPDDKVGLDVAFATLPDGTNHAATTTLDAPAKSVTVEVTNSGYRRQG